MIIMRKNKIISLILILFFLNFSLAKGAVINLWENISESCQPTCEGPTCGNCSLRDVVQFFVNIAKIILRFAGVAALLVFIYGGLLWITSRGAEEQIKKGKNVLQAGMMGLLIILFAYVLVYNLMLLLGKPGEIEQYLPKQEKKESRCEDWPFCGNFPWQSGCKDNRLKKIKEILKNKKCGDLIIDECFDKNTEMAVSKFQDKNGINKSGKIDEETYNCILFGEYDGKTCGNNCQ
jgi:hypothetical protein